MCKNIDSERERETYLLKKNKMKIFERSGLTIYAILTGQIVSLLISGTSVFTEYFSVHKPNKVSIPLFLNFINYFCLSLHLVYRYFANNRLWKPLNIPWWKYVIFAFIDVEANYIIMKAYLYTSMASIALLDAFSIPSAVCLSMLFFGIRYNKRHFIGVLFCFLGVGLSFISDLSTESNSNNKKEQKSSNSDDPMNGNGNPYPHALWGNLLVLLGSFLYALSNVIQESIVKEQMDRIEYLGMLGTFGAIISFLQLFIFEIEELDTNNFFPGSQYLIFGFVTCLFTMYITTSYFLTFADTSLFNMSLLTADFYIAILFIYLFHGTISVEYIFAFICIAIGLFIYGKEPLRAKYEENNDDIKNNEYDDKKSLIVNEAVNNNTSTTNSNIIINHHEIPISEL